MSNKRKENEKKSESNTNNSSTEKLKTVFVLGDSMLKKLNGYLLKKGND